MLQLGRFCTSLARTHVGFQFSTHAAAGGNVAPSSAFEAADLRIYRSTAGAAFSDTQRSSANGITMTSPFDSLTGVHDVDIDLTDDTDSGFYAAGYRYTVMLCPDETVDSQTLTGVVLAVFEIVGPAKIWSEIGGTFNERGGRIWWIDDSSVNESGGDFGDRDHPFDTIEDAIAAASSGDTLRFIQGTYTITTAIETSKILTWEGVSQSGCVITGDASTAGGSGGELIKVPSGTTFRNLTITDTSPATETTVALLLTDVHNITLERCVITAAYQAIFVGKRITAACRNHVYRGCTLTGGQMAVDFQEMQGLQVENTVFTCGVTAVPGNTQGDAVNMYRTSGRFLGCDFNVVVPVSGSSVGASHKANGVSIGVDCGVEFVGCRAKAESLLTSYSGTLSAIRIWDYSGGLVTGTSSSPLFLGCSATSSQAGSAAAGVYDVNIDAGHKAIFVGGTVDTTKVTGAGTFRQIEIDAETAADISTTVNSKIGTPAGASVSADLAAVHAKTTNLPASPAAAGDVTSSTSSILSKLLKYVQLMVRKDAAIATDNATELTAINADGGSGAGSFAPTTDSQEAAVDVGVGLKTNAITSDAVAASGAAEIGAAAGGASTVPVNQVPVPPTRRWILIATDDGLVSEQDCVLKASAGAKLMEIDFSVDLPTNGRVTDVNSVEIISGTEYGITFGEDLDDVDDYGVDRSNAKVRMTPVTAGTYVIRVSVDYDGSDGGGTQEGDVTLVVKE